MFTTPGLHEALAFSSRQEVTEINTALAATFPPDGT